MFSIRIRIWIRISIQIRRRKKIKHYNFYWCYFFLFKLTFFRLNTESGPDHETNTDACETNPNTDANETDPQHWFQQKELIYARL